MKCIDFFCGIGGLSIGLERAGIDVIGGIDNWKDALLTYDYNHLGKKSLLGDVTELSPRAIAEHFDIDLSEVDIVAGGPPCQGFSTVGKRNLLDERNGLWKHYLNLVAEISPRYVLMENVEGLWLANGGRLREQIIDVFSEIGFEIDAALLTSADFGVPQLRKRCIFLGSNRATSPALLPRRRVARYVTVDEAIGDLPELGAAEEANEHTKPAMTAYQRRRRKRRKKLFNHQAANHPPHLVEILRHIPDGGNRRSIPDHLQPKSGFHNSYARLASNKPAIAVTSNMRKPSSARATHPTQHRGLTVREGLRLQSFDDDFVVLGSRTSQYLQVGNAVPPLLAEAIGREIMSAGTATDSRSVFEVA